MAIKKRNFFLLAIIELFFHSFHWIWFTRLLSTAIYCIHFPIKWHRHTLFKSCLFLLLWFSNYFDSHFIYHKNNNQNWLWSLMCPVTHSFCSYIAFAYSIFVRWIHECRLFMWRHGVVPIKHKLMATKTSAEQFPTLMIIRHVIYLKLIRIRRSC